MSTKFQTVLVELTANEEKALRGYFQERTDEPLSELIRKAMRDGIMVESIRCKVKGNGKYDRLS